jgi:hypothetical protein
MPIGIHASKDPASGGGSLQPGTREFYLHAMRVLDESRLPYLVGGGYALGHYTGIERHTKDFDIFVRRRDYDRIMEALARAGYHTELTFPHWLGKVCSEHGYVDVIFSSGNGVAHVDDAWFQHAVEGEVFGLPAKLCPVEEMIWSKASIMERERYDGADIMHLLLACAEKLDWARLVSRFGGHWRLLLMHLCLFGFIYPSERGRIPAEVLRNLLAQLQAETAASPPRERICQGTLISREQYLVDIQRWGFKDARDTTASTMTPDDVVLWTGAIASK